MNAPSLSIGGLSVSLPKGVRVISGRQAKVARTVLGKSVAQLAGACGISESSIRRIESDQGEMLKVDLPLRLQAWFEREGITFRWGTKMEGVEWRV